MTEGINNVFLKLKPICDGIITAPTKDKICQLRDIINNSSNYVIQKLHEYIIFPLYINLENNTSLSATIKQDILETLQCLLEIVNLSKLNLFFQLCHVINKQIFDRQTSSLIPSCDEELKLACVRCLQVLFHGLLTDKLIELYDKKYNMYFPQCVYLCVQLAKNEKMRLLRITAIDCLMTICYVHDQSDFSDAVLRDQVANCLMFVFPGMTIALKDIALGDEKQGHKITALALKALHRIIVLHLEDPRNVAESVIIQYPFLNITKSDEFSKLPQDSKPGIEQMIARLQTETRTNEWAKESSENLFKIIENLVPLQSHYHEKVRLELVEYCENIIVHSSRNLQKSLPLCIDILISLSEDNNLEVANKSKDTLSSMSSTLMDSALNEILSDNFYNVITKLPRLITGTDSQKQLSALNLLVGYLRLLGSNNLEVILQSRDHLDRFINCLMLVSQMERSGITLLEEYAIRDFESISDTPITWKHFKFIGEANLFTKFQNALYLTSESNAATVIIDNLCSLFEYEYENRNEIIFLLNEIISVKVPNMEDRYNIITNILKMYIDEENWYLSTDTTVLSLPEVHNNIIQMSLLVDGLGCMSNALEMNYKTFLLKTLYIILERAGNAHPLISAAGLLTLVKISKACSYDSVTDLIVKNTDYFSFHVTKRLKRLEVNIEVLNVLNVIMKYSTIEVLPPIMEIVNEVLLNSLDKYQDSNITSFLRVFQSFVNSLKRWMNLRFIPQNKIIKLLSDYKKNMDSLYALYAPEFDSSDETIKKSVEQMYEEDLKERNDELLDPMEDRDTKKPEIPPHIQLTVNILKRVLNFLPSKDRDRKLSTLGILKDGVEIIHTYEDELLPVVHLIWSPLIERFKEYEDPLIINKSIELLATLAQYSKDFIRSRTCKEVLPEICQNLTNLSSKSYLKDRGSSYRYTQQYKLQLILLQQIAQIVTDLDMSKDHVTEVVKSITTYLSCKQPLPLQESAVFCYKSLACHDFDAVWLHLIEIYHNSEEDSVKKELRKNCEVVLKCLEVIHW